MMVEQPSAWADQSRAKTRSREEARARLTLGRGRLSFHPLIWLRAYPLVLPTLLIALTGLMYMLQVNQSDGLDFQLSYLQSEQSNKSGEYAQLSALHDRLTSCQRVCTVAVKRLDMAPADLTRALWINVQLPPTRPVLPRQPRVDSGPLSWMSNTWTAFRNSL